MHQIKLLSLVTVLSIGSCFASENERGIVLRDKWRLGKIPFHCEGSTGLHFLILQKAPIEIIQDLIGVVEENERLDFINQPNSDGFTAEHLATLVHPSALRCLWELGADKDIKFPESYKRIAFESELERWSLLKFPSSMPWEPFYTTYFNESSLTR